MTRCIITAALLLSLIASAPAFGQTAEDKARIDYEAAKLALQQNQPAVALAKFEGVISVLGEQPELLCLAAQAALAALDYDKANDYKQRAFAKADDNFKRSPSYRKLIEVSARLELLADPEARQRDQEDRARRELARRGIPASEEALRAATQRGDAETVRLLGLACVDPMCQFLKAADLDLKQGRPAAALSKYEHFLAASSPNAGYLWLTARAALAAGQENKARDYTRRALALADTTDDYFRTHGGYPKLIELAERLGVSRDSGPGPRQQVTSSAGTDPKSRPVAVDPSSNELRLKLPEFPDIPLVSFSGENSDLKSHLGRKSTLLYFWATSVPFSLDWLANIQALAEQAQARQNALLAINLQFLSVAERGREMPDRIATLNRFLQGFLPTITSRTFMLDRQTEEALPIKSLPFTALLDGQGHVIKTFVGMSQEAMDETRLRIDGLASQK